MAHHQRLILIGSTGLQHIVNVFVSWNIERPIVTGDSWSQVHIVNDVGQLKYAASVCHLLQSFIGQGHCIRTVSIHAEVRPSYHTYCTGAPNRTNEWDGHLTALAAQSDFCLQRLLRHAWCRLTKLSMTVAASSHVHTLQKGLSYIKVWTDSPQDASECSYGLLWVLSRFTAADEA